MLFSLLVLGACSKRAKPYPRWTWDQPPGLNGLA